MTAVGQYRKKPVVIEAMLVTAGNLDEVAKWCGGKVRADSQGVYGVAIETLEGTMQADDGDFVIKGVKGEFYPCKPDIFEATYDEVKE